MNYILSSLDNDFITLWSKFLISANIDEIFDDLTCLAELGQIDALKYYFQYSQYNVKNIEIERHLKNLKSKQILNSDELMVLAYKTRLEKKEDYDQLDKRVAEARNELADCEVAILYESRKAKTLQQEVKLDPSLIKKVEQKKKKWQAIKSKALTKKFYKLKNLALTSAMKECKTSSGLRKIIAYEKVMELNSNKPGFEKEKIFDQSTREVFKNYLAKEFSNDPENVKVAFAFAQNILLYNIMATVKDIETTNTILENLKNREFSVQMQEKIKSKSVEKDKK